MVSSENHSSSRGTRPHSSWAQGLIGVGLSFLLLGLCLAGWSVGRRALDVIIDAGHSRIPLYEDTIDNIVGLLYTKDLLRRIVAGEGKPTLNTAASTPLRAASRISYSTNVSVNLGKRPTM